MQLKHPKLQIGAVLYGVGIVLGGPAWPITLPIELYHRLRDTNDLAHLIGDMGDEEDNPLTDVELMIDWLDDMYEENEGNLVLSECVNSARHAMQLAKAHIIELEESNSRGISLNEIMEERQREAEVERNGVSFD